MKISIQVFLRDLLDQTRPYLFFRLLAVDRLELYSEKCWTGFQISDNPVQGFQSTSDVYANLLDKAGSRRYLVLKPACNLSNDEGGLKSFVWNLKEVHTRILDLEWYMFAGKSDIDEDAYIQSNWSSSCRDLLTRTTGQDVTLQLMQSNFKHSLPGSHAPSVKLDRKLWASELQLCSQRSATLLPDCSFGIHHLM